MTCQQAESILTAAYMAEVEYRGRSFINDEHTRENIARFAKFLTDGGNRFGILFSGKYGNGKTTLLYAFQNSLNYLYEQGYIGRDYTIQVVDAKEVAVYARDAKKFSAIKDAESLALEDIGREQLGMMDYGNVINPVIDLLEHRYNYQLFTVITTNLNPKEIRSKYGNRIADRFNEMFESIIFQNESYRR